MLRFAIISGAGIQADLKTFTAHAVYGTSVLTVVTAQNTLGVQGVQALYPELVTQQLDAVLSDIGTDAIKIGALVNSEITRAVGRGLKAHFPELNAANSKLVLDPVMVTSSGDKLLERDAVRTMIEELFPITFVLTPNVPEVEALLEELGVGGTGGGDINQNSKQSHKVRIGSLEDMKKAAIELAKHGPCIILVKGGHLPFRKGNGNGEPVKTIDVAGAGLELVDLIYDTRTGVTSEVRRDFIQSQSTHGTGCTLSAAIASNLALGLEANQAIEKAIDYVQGAIRQAQAIGGLGTGPAGQGHGPLNHSHAILHRAIELPSSQNSQPFTSHLLRKFAPEWKKYTEHAFVEALGRGTLPRKNFIHYIKQDYLFLSNYARANGLAAFKARSLLESEVYAKNVVTITHETKMHVEFCAQWGVSFEELVATQESMANVAYTRYVLDVGANGDVLDLCVALAPCLIGYGHIGERLMKDEQTVRGEKNPYWGWISIYAGDGYQSDVRRGIGE